ncbi:MAG: exopolyphosphatase, partial [Gammaproteobacteria bacterium]
SAYVIENADMAGFSRQDQLLLSALVLSHKKKISIKNFKDLPSPWDQKGIFLAIVLRLAVLLHRNRHDVDLPQFTFTVDVNRIHLQFAENWLQNSPLTIADLEQEAEHLESAGFFLTFG